MSNLEIVDGKLGSPNAPLSGGHKFLPGEKNYEVQKGFLGRPKLNEKNETDKLIQILILSALIISAYTVLFRVEYKWDSFSAKSASEIASSFFRIDLVPNHMKVEMLLSLVNTLALGFVSTIVGFVAGIVFGLFAARNISNNTVASVISAFASFIRSVPTIIWVLIFVSGYGLSATTAVVGMFFHTLAFFIKSFAETFEEIDIATIEALRATGSNWTQVVFGAVLPSSLTRIISWLAIRYEINFATAVIIGPAVGVPGTIGTLINNAAREGNYSVQGFGVLLIFITAFIMETVINRVRVKSIIDQ